MTVIRELSEIVAIHELDTEVLAASIRNPLHMTQAALAGAHVATLPFKVLKQMVHHPLTDSGIVQFRSDWEKARQALAARDGGAEAGSRGLGQQARRVTDAPVAATRRSSASSWATRPSRSAGTRTSRRTSSGSTTTCTSRTRSARCSSTSAAGGSRATTCSAGSGRRSRSTGWPRTSTATSTRRPSRPIRTCASRAPNTAPATVPASLATRPTRRRWAPTSTPSCRCTARTSPTGGATGSCPRCSATSTILEERLDAAEGMSLAETATLLEDAIDIHDRHWKIHWMLNFAQLSATLNLRAVMEKHRGAVDEQLLGRLQNSASDRNWDSIEALWRMKNEVRDDPELRAAFAAEAVPDIVREPPRDGPRPAVHRRARPPVPARVRLARGVEPRVHLPDGPRAHGAGHRARPWLSHDRLRLPDRHRGDARGHRGGLARDPRGADRRGARRDARRQRHQPAHGAADARPPLLHRPGGECARAPRPDRSRSQARRRRPPRPAGRRDVPALQRAPEPDRQRRCARRPGDRRGPPAGARGCRAHPPARLGRHGHAVAARLPVPRQLGLPGPLLPAAVGRRARDHRHRRVAPA